MESDYVPTLCHNQVKNRSFKCHKPFFMKHEVNTPSYNRLLKPNTMKKLFILSQVILLVTFFSLYAMNGAKSKRGNPGVIQGKVIDAKTKDGIAFATIKLT